MTTPLLETVVHALEGSGIDLSRLGLAWARVAPTVAIVPAFGIIPALLSSSWRRPGFIPLRGKPGPFSAALGRITAVFPGTPTPGPGRRAYGS